MIVDPPIILILLWLILSFIVRAAANERGRDSTRWFILSLISSPPMAVLLLMAFPIKEPEKTKGIYYKSGDKR